MSQQYDGNEELNIATAKKYSIRSKNVWIQEKSDFLDAYIFVDGEIIADVLLPSNQQKQTEELLKTFPLYYDYGDLYIFPGLIDLNVSLHIGTDWEEIEQTTELYLKGGVTTIACQPLLTDEIFLKDELVSIKNRKNRIQKKSNTDYCFFANLYPENISQLEHIYQEPGVAGFKNGAGWVETKKDMDSVLKKLNEFRQKLEVEEISPTLIENQCKKQFQCNHKNLLVTFHSIKSGEKELTITSPLRQRRIEERCDRTTQIKRTQGDSIQGETQKGKKKQEINYDDYQFEVLTMGQISEQVNDNILNFQNHDHDSDQEFNQDLNPENNKSLYDDTFKEKENNANQNGDQPHYSSHSNREKLIKMYGKASINSTENLQIQLLSRAERKTYNNQDESDNENEEFISSDSQYSEEQDKSSDKEDCCFQNDNNSININKLEDNSSLSQENQAKLEKSTSFCSPMSSPSSQRYASMSPKSELCQKEYRKGSQESSDENRIQDQIPFPVSNQSTYSYEIDSINTIEYKNTTKVIKMQKVQQEDCNVSCYKDDEKAGTLNKIDEKVESARDSNSENELENSFNQNEQFEKAHKKSLNDRSERSGSECSNYLFSYKTKSLINSKRSSHDITYINQNQNNEGSQIKLIRDMKRGSCEKDSHSFINENNHTFKKSNFRVYNNDVQSMVEINKSENSSPSLNARSSKLFEKRKSRTLTVQIVDLKLSPENNTNNQGKTQNQEDEIDQNTHEPMICLKSSGQIGEEQPSSQSLRDTINYNNEFGGFQHQQNNRFNIPHCNSSIFLAKIHSEKEDFSENQMSNNGFKDEYSTRKQSSDSGSNHSIGNHLLNQSMSSLTGVNANTQNIISKQNNDSSKLCECCNLNCKCIHSNIQIQKRSKFNQDYLTFLAFRPPYWEYFGIQLIRDSLERNLISSKVKLNVVFANIGNSNSMYRITVLKQDLEKKNKNIHLLLFGVYLVINKKKQRSFY